jgi:hypothetical protein
MRLVLALLAVGLIVVPLPVQAGGSSPLLSLTAVDAFDSSSGVVSVVAHGSFNFEDVVEGVFPAGLVVFQGNHFARFDQAGAVVEGNAASLAGGLDPTEVPALLGLGAPAPAPAALTRLRSDRVSVVLPADFAPGAASVVLYAVYAGQGFASNAVSVTLP